MSKRICELDGRLTTCPYNCEACLAEEEKLKKEEESRDVKDNVSL